MAEASPLRVGLIGAGFITGLHLRGWTRSPGAEVVAVCDPVRDRAQTRADAFRIPNVFETAEDMLAAAALDAVDIAAPVETHAQLVRLAAANGLHVLCQKPLTPTVAVAEALIEEVGDRVRFMVHENHRFRPQYRALKAWIDDGRLGEIRHARMTVRSSGMVPCDGGLPPQLERQPYLAKFRRLIIFEVLIHLLDVARALFGPLHVIHTRTAQVNRTLLGEDVAHILLGGVDGFTLTVDGSLSAPGYPPRPSDRLEVMGSRETAVFDHDSLYIVGQHDSLRSFDLDEATEACFRDATHHFVTALHTGAPFETDRLDNLETLRLMEESYLAAGIAP